jgi:raffinose/stachyose/melibiose transport system permease protein
MALFRYTWKTFAREMVLLACAIVFVFPVYIIVVFSFQTPDESLIHPISPPTHPTTENFSQAWQGSGGVTFGHAAISSAIVTVGSVAVLLVLGSLGAYTLARRTSRLSSALYLLFVSGIIIPFQLAIVPVFVAMQRIGLAGTYPGMILLYVGLLMPLTVFLYTGFIRALPKDYEESAEVDGASFTRTFLRVVLPLLRPVTGTVAILTGIIVWNDFFNPLVFLSGTDNLTLPVVIYSYANEFTNQWNLVFAGVAIAMVPVVLFYVIAQRQLIKGFSSGIRG